MALWEFTALVSLAYMAGCISAMAIVLVIERVASRRASRWPF